ncbi:hypothetical protein PHMEG_00034129 [Phytophthora megakarya]|uniref:Uncharacterized protein n=1 Tax=Phytophthora megakarya TaxID=4795 RepID=A0A225US16_9STRA|nr:hypothetical protein PHMEG_00034129 [Phytophthora megakarya]
MTTFSNEDGESATVQEWAFATTKKWAREVQREISREKHRARTARYRAKQHVKQKVMLQEFEQLQQTLRHGLAGLESKLGDEEEALHSTVRAVLQLTLERRKLVSENTKLCKSVSKLSNFTQVIVEESNQHLHHELKTPLNEKEQRCIRDSRWRPAPPTPSRIDDGWRVHFPNGEPSFFFHPFTREAYDGMLKRCDDHLAENPPHIQVVDSLFGWTVHHAPLTRRTADNSLVAHARFSRRVNCSLTDADNAFHTLDIDAWPIIATPPGHVQVERTHCQILQEFDSDAFVLVRNIPGPLNFRYVHLARRLFRKQANGEPTITYATVIADSEANTRNRAAEEPQPNVHWLQEGGTYIKLAQVDDTTIDVTYDHWSSCSDELHARHLFIQWAEYAVKMQQWVQPTRILSE